MRILRWFDRCFWPVFLVAVVGVLNTAGFFFMDDSGYSSHGFPSTYAVHTKDGTWSFSLLELLLNVVVGLAASFLFVWSFGIWQPSNTDATATRTSPLTTNH